MGKNKSDKKNNKSQDAENVEFDDIIRRLVQVPPENIKKPLKRKPKK